METIDVLVGGKPAKLTGVPPHGLSMKEWFAWPYERILELEKIQLAFGHEKSVIWANSFRENDAKDGIVYPDAVPTVVTK